MDIRFDNTNRNCIFNALEAENYNDVEHIIKEIAEESDIQYINNYTLEEVANSIKKVYDKLNNIVEETSKGILYKLNLEACKDSKLLTIVLRTCRKANIHILLVVPSKLLQGTPNELLELFNMSMTYNWTIVNSNKDNILRCLHNDFISNKEKLFTAYNKSVNGINNLIFEDIEINTMESIIHSHKIDLPTSQQHKFAVDTLAFHVTDLEPAKDKIPQTYNEKLRKLLPFNSSLCTALIVTKNNETLYTIDNKISKAYTEIGYSYFSHYDIKDLRKEVDKRVELFGKNKCHTFDMYKDNIDNKIKRHVYMIRYDWKQECHIWNILKLIRVIGFGVILVINEGECISKDLEESFNVKIIYDTPSYNDLFELSNSLRCYSTDSNSMLLSSGFSNKFDNYNLATLK